VYDTNCRHYETWNCINESGRFVSQLYRIDRLMEYHYCFTGNVPVLRVDDLMSCPLTMKNLLAVVPVPEQYIKL